MAPLFVGSNSDDSRIRSDRVSVAASTSNPASAVTGDAYYNSSDNALKIYSGSDWASVGAGGGSITGIASGSLSDGQAAIVHSDGKVGAISTTGVTLGIGSSDTWYTGGNLFTASAYDPIAQRVAVFYRDTSASSYGKVVIGTVTGLGITFGSPVQFVNSETANIAAVYDESGGRILFAFRKDGPGEIDQITISGDVPTPFSGQTLHGGSTQFISAAYDSTAKRSVFCYRDNSDSNYLKANVVQAVGGGVVGLTIGSEQTVAYESVSDDAQSGTGEGKGTQVVYHAAKNRMVATFYNGSTGRAGTFSVNATNNTISASSFNNFNNGSTRAISTVYDENAKKVVIVYRDNSNSNRGTALIADIDDSSNNMIYGTPVVFETNTIYKTAVQYDPSTKKVLVFWTISSPTNATYVAAGTVSGDSITFEEKELIVADYESDYMTSVYDSNNEKVVFSYRGGGHQSNDGMSYVIRTPFVDTNLTADNFAGFSNAAYTNGQTATIQVSGSVDDAQSGLTTARTHYVQNDGTLSTTAGTPSVVGGTAISATKIIVQG
tara:strand:+ start:1390 stop:3036 length:1647 start_codon:yes stop_codon:yes gene_type:complete